jgi:DNA-binding CsgD family transcriptional regulator
MTKLTEREIELNMRAVEHAIAQQELEGLKVSEQTVEDMRRAARGEIDSDDVIANIYARFQDVPILRGRPLS